MCVCVSVFFFLQVKLRILKCRFSHTLSETRRLVRLQANALNLSLCTNDLLVHRDRLTTINNNNTVRSKAMKIIACTETCEGYFSVSTLFGEESPADSKPLKRQTPTTQFCNRVHTKSTILLPVTQGQGSSSSSSGSSRYKRNYFSKNKNEMKREERLKQSFFFA